MRLGICILVRMLHEYLLPWFGIRNALRCNDADYLKRVCEKIGDDTIELAMARLRLTSIGLELSRD